MIQTMNNEQVAASCKRRLTDFSIVAIIGANSDTTIDDKQNLLDCCQVHESAVEDLSCTGKHSGSLASTAKSWQSFSDIQEDDDDEIEVDVVGGIYETTASDEQVDLRCNSNSNSTSDLSSSRLHFAADNSQQYHRAAFSDNLKPSQQRPRKYQCGLCSLSLNNRGQLSSHIRSHTGERPFKCDHKQCNKSFTRNEELTRHKRIHTGQRPFACFVCAKRFGRKDHLKKHLNTHTKHGSLAKAISLMSSVIAAQKGAA